MEYIDISPLIHEKTAVYPGDTGFSRRVSLDMNQGHNLTLSDMSTTLHIGAHVDAPNHYSRDGAGIEARSLNLYMGLCQVIRVKVNRGERILPFHIKNEKILAPRVLFSTSTFPNPDQWNGDFASLSPELVAELHDQGVLLIGIDTPSIDPAESKALESHNAIAERDMAILEGIVLDDVPVGLYTLLALPLRILKADASPVRAILLPQHVSETF